MPHSISANKITITPDPCAKASLSRTAFSKSPDNSLPRIASESIGSYRNAIPPKPAPKSTNNSDPTKANRRERVGEYSKELNFLAYRNRPPCTIINGHHKTSYGRILGNFLQFCLLHYKDAPFFNGSSAASQPPLIRFGSRGRISFVFARQSPLNDNGCNVNPLKHRLFKPQRRS